ncbi:hypothetical protein OH76DRAFT_1413169 [Lentinus brumalis]|uniref:Uncharacterized protein n=1 Tax=Lentinus brumalis TaxID=2498619 RepID=A0A371CIM1_9APHY|nr:hypothetical protein OH76DRAFT_1413169 [Polyporus brumalis]
MPYLALPIIPTSHPGRGYVRRVCTVSDAVDVAGSSLRGHPPESLRPQNRGPSSPPCTQCGLPVCVALNMVDTGHGLTRRLDRLPSDGHAAAVVRICRCFNAGRRAVPSHEQTVRLRQQQSSRRTNYYMSPRTCRSRAYVQYGSCSPGFTPAGIAGLPAASSDESGYGRLQLLVCNEAVHVARRTWLGRVEHLPGMSQTLPGVSRNLTG